MATRFSDHILGGVFADRPAASLVPVGGLYASFDTFVIYQTDGTSWSSWLEVSNPDEVTAEINTKVAAAIDALKGGVSNELDTLAEIAQALADDETALQSLLSVQATKLTRDELKPGYGINVVASGNDRTVSIKIPSVLLEAGQGVGNIPAGTPDGAIVFRKGA